MKKSIFALFLFYISCFNLIAQRTVTGTITEGNTGISLAGAHVIHEHKNLGTVADTLGRYRINWNPKDGGLKFSFPGCEPQIITPGTSDTLDVVLYFNGALSTFDTVITFDPETYEEQLQVVRNDLNLQEALGRHYQSAHTIIPPQSSDWNTEDYSPISENNDKDPFLDPLSTFSIDVDNASYSNVRRFINQGQTPPIDAVRIEEMINYFDYDYPKPRGKHPFSITTEQSECPWNNDRKLLLIGLQGKDIDYDKLPPSNLVFLLDVSGSMRSPNKLPLVQSAMNLLVDQLREEDQISIVVYAGAAGLVLPPTPGTDKEKIRQAIENLRAGGSTAGGEGIQLAYQTAKTHFLPDGNNRVILATDGDFNIGISSDGELTRLIEEKRKENIFLSVLGFGMGNYKDNKLELLADKGNGNYAYIDEIEEAQKVFVRDLRANLFTLAKDVKIQVEFNPHLVHSYRLVGYENRLLNKEDFNDDTKDAGELGAGHQVTALYELKLREEDAPTLPGSSVDPLRFQSHVLTQTATRKNELASIQFRYKPVDSDQSELIEEVIKNKPTHIDKVSDNFRTATVAAGFGLLLRKSGFNKDLQAEKLLEMARQTGRDAFGYRKELAGLVEKYGSLQVKVREESH